ncbi:hypothetical protein [Roseovarius salis]|uniref:hypothetical protein n=1 Tax=Roseovarius salis TaxID=3376063 RepID=UPI0037C66EA0
MIRGLACMIVTVFWAGAGWSQVADVRAGEHDTFTRLVFRLPSQIPYTIDRQGRTAELRFERPGLSFDTSVVFQRVPRTRLAAIDGSQGGGQLRLSLGCDCDIRTFWYDRSALVLDIGDPSPRDKEREPPGAAPMETRGAGLRPLPLPEMRPSGATRLVARALDTAAAEVPAPRRRQAELDASRARLLEQLGRAASQGLLTPVQSGSRIPRPDAPIGRARQTRTVHDGAADPHSKAANLQAESSIDRAMRSNGPAQAQAVTEQRCLDPALVDVTGWADDRPFTRQLGALRSGILGEFDAPDPAAVTALARLYIHFGFGAEARQVVLRLGAELSHGDVLAAMSGILENGDAGEDAPVLAGQMDCAPHTALWSALSRREIPAGQPMDSDAILRALSALPPHLRGYLGPMLAQRFLGGGYRNESERVRRMLDRSEETATPAGNLVGAEIALSRGEVANAEEALGKLVAENVEPSAEALVRLIDSRLQRGAEISYETAQLAGAYALEHRETRLGRSLARAHIQALAVSGAFDEAFDKLDALDPSDRAGNSELRSRLVGHLTRLADDYDFMRHVTSPDVAQPEQLDPDTMNKVLRRLLSLGFVSTASRFAQAETQGSGPVSRERRLLRAEIALRSARPNQALLDLMPVSGEDADRLRAEARSKAGGHATAHDIYAALGEEEAARREAWLAADWRALAEDGQGPVPDVAKAMLDMQAQPNARAAGVLARNRSLLDASRQTRATLGAMLKAWPAPARSLDP